MSRGLLLILAVLLSACLRQAESLHPDEAEVVARWVEECAHAGPADPAELVRPQGSLALTDLAAWVDGGQEADGRHQPVRLLADRAARWPVLRHGLAAGALLVDADGGLHLAPGASGDDRRLFEPLVQRENLDRAALSSILCQRGRLPASGRRGAALLARLAELRRERAQAAGGRPWRPSESNSANAATTSSSKPAASPAPAR